MKIPLNTTVSDDSQSKQPWPILRLAFRPFFWFGALFGIYCIGIWSLSFNGLVTFSPYGGGLFWHLHEMLFGFTVAIIVGFLLTAVQTWTGVKSIQGWPLFWLWLLWLFPRLLMSFNLSNHGLLVAFLDLLFLPAAALALAIPIVKARLWRNLFFVPILLLMTCLNGLMHWAMLTQSGLDFVIVAHTMIMLVVLVMFIMGGRVIPMFTANGTGTQKVAPWLWLERLALLSMVLSVLVTAGSVYLPELLMGVAYSLTGISNGLRALRWRIWVTWTTPLVWSLHVSYGAVCLGLLMLGLAKVLGLHHTSLAYHAITVGGISFMILSMIARVSLGHTGRMIQAPLIMTMAFGMMFLAFLTRVLAPLIWGIQQAVFVSGGLWVAAYVCFLIHYAPIVFKPRIDGAMG